ncbi:MAG: hypothetical protein ILA11_11075 [Butyrivibrio sp.]|nr:hypothetical protein [Butyrivibrio sp.]
MDGTLFYALNDEEYKPIGNFNEMGTLTESDLKGDKLRYLRDKADELRYIRSDETAILNMSLKVCDLKLLCKMCGLSYYEFTHPRHKQRRRIKLKRHYRNRIKQVVKELERVLLYGKEACK